MRPTPRSFATSATLVASVACVAALAACGAPSGGGSGGGGTAATASSSHPDSILWVRPSASNGFDGDKCVDTSIPLDPAVYDTLLTIKLPNGDGLAPGLAQSWSWDAKTLTYTFDLQKNAKFSNGKPVTAADVVFSVNQWVTGSFSGSYYVNIKKAVAVSPTTVAIEMKKTDTFLPDLLTWCTSPIYPANYAGEGKTAFFNKPIGAGPYEVTSYTDPEGSGEKITLKPNPYYYAYNGKPPAIKTFEVDTVPDASQRALMFQSGQADLLDSVDAATASGLAKDTIKKTLPDSIWGLVLNVKSGPLADPKVRQAISLGINRTVVAESMNNGSYAAKGYLPVNTPGTPAPTTPYAYDPAKAKQLISESSSSKGLTVTLIFDGSDQSNEDMAQALQQQLAAIGVTLKLQSTDSNTVNARMENGNYQMAFSGASSISPTAFDPISWLAILYGWTGDKSQEVQDEFVKGTSTTVKSQQLAAASAVQDFIMNGNALIGVVDTTATYAAQNWISGFTPLQYGTFYFNTIRTK